jgi:VanZ family protein
MSGGRPLRIAVLFGALALIILTLPYVGKVRSALGDEGVRLPLFILFGLCAAGFLLFHVRLLRGKPARWIGLAVFVVLFGAVFVMLKGPNPAVGLVEKVHLFQYSLLAVLFWWAFHRRFPGPQIYAHGLLFTLAAGLLDEYVQHLLPIRVGEIRDVWINFLAGGLGLLYVALVVRPGPGRPVPAARAWCNILIGLALFLPLLGVFVHQVQIGYRIVDREAGVAFITRFTPERLPEENRIHGEQWASSGEPFNPEETVAGFRTWAIEDFYITEALRHIGARNHHLDAGRPVMAAMEQKILLRHYPAVMRALSPRLPAEVRRQLRRQPGLTAEAPVESTEGRHLFTWIAPGTLWTAILVAAGLFLAGAAGLRKSV